MRNTSNQLLEFLSKVPGERVFLKSKITEVTYKEIFNKVSTFEVDYTFLRDKRCAIKSNDRETLAVYLPSIANLAKSIFLQPSNLSEGEVCELYNSIGIEYVIDLGEGIVRVDDLDCCLEDESLEGGRSNCTWILATSGTTSTPKLASYNFESLIATVVLNVDKGSEFTWGLNYDLNRFAGLQVYFQAILSGSTLIISEGSWSVENTVKCFVKGGVNVMSATPSFWRRLLMCTLSPSLKLKRITLGGEVSSQSILSALSKAYPASKIAHIYASTEAGVGFTVRDGKEGFPLDICSSNKNVDLKINNGTLWIRSNRSSDKLLKGSVDIDPEGFIDSGDLVVVKGGRVFFLGRDSGAINVGGNKVIPEEVESTINALDFVLESRVSGKPNSILGMIVVAEVVLNKPEDLEIKDAKKKLLEYCRSNLAAFKVPGMLKFVDGIQVNETGKIQR